MQTKPLLIRLFSLCALFCLLANNTAHAGWSEDIRLTYRGYEIEPQIIARNDTVHVVFQEVAGPMRISYLRSANGGYDWNNIMDLTQTGHRGSMPDLSVSQNKVLIGWSDIDTNPVNWVANVGYSISLGGGSWPLAPSYVFNRWQDQGYRMSMALGGDSIYFAYIPLLFDSSGNQLILFKYSSNLGITWSDSVIIGRTHEYLNGFGLKKCGESIYVIWSGEGQPRFGIMAAISHDDGQSWESQTRQLSYVDATAQQPCIACDEETGNLVVGWVDSRDSHTFPGDLYLRVTTDAGYTWGDEICATTHHKVADPSLALKGDSIWAVWSDWDFPSYGYDNAEIAFSKSTDLGVGWSPYERLTYAVGYSYTPWMSYDDGKLHLVWWDQGHPPDSNSNDEIYYKRYDPGSDAIIGDEIINIPNEITLKAYPNPFNSSAIISYLNLNKGGDINIYDVQGKLIKAFKTEGKEGKIIWDARDAMGNKVSSGIYFARAGRGTNLKSLKLIYLK
jgi:hypothetical protein